MIWPQRPASDAPRGAGAPNAAEPPHPPPGGEIGAGEAIAPCGCDDHSLDRLRDMVRAGMGQMEASRAIWGVAT